MMVAERGFDPLTFGLWAQHANHCAHSAVITSHDSFVKPGHLHVWQVKVTYPKTSSWVHSSVVRAADCRSAGP